MSKVRELMACRSCGHPVGQWVGRCPSCAEWGTIEKAASGTALSAEPLIQEGRPSARLSTGYEGFDRVLGGGLVPGSVVLVAGEPGIGKSTLLLQVAANLSREGLAAMYASGEESRDQVASRARRLGLQTAPLSYLFGRDLPAVAATASEASPAVLIVDSIQAIRDPELASLPGGPAQVRACCDALVGLAKERGVAVMLAGQITKDGDIAGPRTLEHAVDVVCAFDGDPRTGLRVLSGGKNRFGAEGEVAWFEMDAAGLREVEPSSVLGSAGDQPGAATALVAAGRRALAIEVQALVVPTQGTPRRQVSGLDPRRFGLIAAVLERNAGVLASRAELYGATAGGLRVEEPGADLAVAAALFSAARGVAPPAGSAFVGEVSLTGVVRPAPNLPARLIAAAAHGLTAVFCAGEVDPPPGVAVHHVRHVRDALSWALGKHDATATSSRI